MERENPESSEEMGEVRVGREGVTWERKTSCRNEDAEEGQGGVLLILKQDVNNGKKWLNLITDSQHFSPQELHTTISPLPLSKFRQKLSEGEERRL